MAKDQRRAVSRIKYENLPTVSQTQAKVGPLGIVRKEPLPNEEGIRVSIGQWVSFTIPDGIAFFLY